MKIKFHPFLIGILIATLLIPVAAAAQGTRADYARADGLREQWQGLALNLPERPPVWVGDTHRFWYRRSVKAGSEFMLGNADTGTLVPAFDHVRLAAALAAEIKDKVDPWKLPFAALTFVDDGKAVQFEASDFRWKADLSTYALTKVGPADASADNSHDSWVGAIPDWPYRPDVKVG